LLHVWINPIPFARGGTTSASITIVDHSYFELPVFAAAVLY